MSDIFKPSIIESKHNRKSVMSAVLEKLSYHRVFRITGVTLAFISHVLLYTTALGARTYFVTKLLRHLGSLPTTGLWTLRILVYNDFYDKHNR